MLRLLALAAVVGAQTECDSGDGGWVKKGKPEGATCAWVAADPNDRCGKKSSGKVKASDACCACEAVTKPPTSTPEPPTMAPDCEDDSAWLKKGKPSNADCAWVAVDPGGRCHKKSRDKVKARDACACACAPPETLVFDVRGWLILQIGDSRRRLQGGGDSESQRVLDWTQQVNNLGDTLAAICGALADVGIDASSCLSTPSFVLPTAADVMFTAAVAQPGSRAHKKRGWDDQSEAALDTVREALRAAAESGALQAALDAAAPENTLLYSAEVRVADMVDYWDTLTADTAWGPDPAYATVTCDSGTPAPTSPTPAPVAILDQFSTETCEMDFDCHSDWATCAAGYDGTTNAPYYFADCDDFFNFGSCEALVGEDGVTENRCWGDYLRTIEDPDWTDVTGDVDFDGNAVTCAAGEEGVALTTQVFTRMDQPKIQVCSWESLPWAYDEMGVPLPDNPDGAYFVGFIDASADVDGPVKLDHADFAIEVNGAFTTVVESGEVKFTVNPPRGHAPGDVMHIGIQAGEVRYYANGNEIYISDKAADADEYQIVVNMDGTHGHAGFTNMRVVLPQPAPDQDE
jgi:hypothetical protein